MIQTQVRIDGLGRHGMQHWAKVYEIGVKLAGQTGADRDKGRIAGADISGVCYNGASYLTDTLT